LEKTRYHTGIESIRIRIKMAKWKSYPDLYENLLALQHRSFAFN
jgi:hypothetical protein